MVPVLEKGWVSVEKPRDVDFIISETPSDIKNMSVLSSQSLTLYGHIKTAEQRTGR